MWAENAATVIASYLPPSIKSTIRRVFFKNSHPNHLALKGVGAVQDLYYWVADGRFDTLLPIENYFSVFFPKLNTATSVSLTMFDSMGSTIGKHALHLSHLGCVMLRVSDLLNGFDQKGKAVCAFGTLLCDIAVPSSVQAAVASAQPFYFWDRFYIAYVNQVGQPTFVHGVDKTIICPTGNHKTTLWYSPLRKFQWAPEIPINMAEYEKFSVIMINRVSRPSKIRLVVEDSNDRTMAWEAVVEPMGVHRFELTADNTAGLHPVEMRMRVEGMTSQWGRPLVFKEFPSGAISVMHC